LIKNARHVLAWFSGLFASNTRESWQIIFLCVIAATTFWFFNALNNTYTTRINYPIEFVFDDEEVVVVDKLPNRVSLDVSGGGWNLLRRTLWFRVNPIQVRLDNPSERKYILGSSLKPLIAEQINEVNLNFILTDTLPINIERKMYKKVAVEVDSASISLGSYHRISSTITVEPDSIEFQGPSSYIESLANFIPIQIPKQDIVQDYKADVTVRPENASSFIQVFPENVVVSFEVSSFSLQEKLVKLEKLNFPADSSLYLKRDDVVVTFHVDEKNLERVQDARFKVAVNLRKLNLNDSTLTPVIVQHPDFVFDISIDPPALKVVHEQKNL
jgi:hypothetical protein